MFTLLNATAATRQRTVCTEENIADVTKSENYFKFLYLSPTSWS